MSQGRPSEVVAPEVRDRPWPYYTAAYLQAGLLGAMLTLLFADFMLDYMVPLEGYKDGARPLANYGRLLTGISLVTYGCLILLEWYLTKWRKPNTGRLLRGLLAAYGMLLAVGMLLFVVFFGIWPRL